MKKFTLLLLFPFCCIAQIPAYYSSVNFTLTGNSLKNQLATLITETHTNELVYTPEVWTALEQADLDPDNNNDVFLIYGYNDTDNNTDNDRTRDKDDNCHTSSCDGLWVREHVFPRSLGEPNLEYEGPGADAHHLRAIDYDMNNDRGNRRFADGSGNATILAGGLFYPGDEWRGDIARMMMYMYVRYGNQCKANTVGSGSSSYSTLGDMPNVFLEWNAEDPVSQYEMNRNTVLQNMQGNRNPFIDNPYLATVIWNGPQAQNTWGNLSVTELSVNVINVYPTVTDGIVYVENSTGNFTYTVYNSLGQEVKSNTDRNTINIAGNTSGIYILNIKTPNSIKTFKVLLK